MSRPLSQVNIKAVRKRHLCEWCGQWIVAGSPAFCYTIEDGGAFQRSYMHMECRDAMWRETWYDDDLPYDVRRGMTVAETEAYWHYIDRCEEALRQLPPDESGGLPLAN